MSPEVHVVSHPLVQHKLSLMRRETTSVSQFRQLLEEISMLLAYELTRDFPLSTERIKTPIAEMDAPVIEGKKLVIISILRAGDGFLTGMLRVIPSARVGHIGLYRDPKTLMAVEYYFKVPGDLADRDVIVVDPMLATGNSAVAAVDRIKSRGPKSIKLMCLLAAPEGIKTLHETHPDVPVWTCAVDEKLNEKGYIVPGLGDAGDRLFGTK
ncbi:uracil phosphoribosyltransferase [Sandaracinus amylolyticus]|uniref:Uracil phosphoribosyltransferase n=1 Tax=Sandaracinus amylolyticus TaxID=927083 RepID=A0A0F6W1D9_9BACT|nr:uracil phosphoribosyltransferase [Sandaracinus amylolyticus]AKF05018.1 Uracil phosphoribosyltransferase [Sandaracinus amylolyticus]